MKGIIKGSIFSGVLIGITACILAVISMFLVIPVHILRGIVWILFGLCTFMGSLPVSKSATNYKLLHGIGSSLTTVILLFITACTINKNIPSNGTFYAFTVVCMLCGLLGSLSGSKK